MLEVVALNAAYALYVSTGFVKTVFQLRIMLIVVSAAFVSWGVISGVWVSAAWNAAFGVVHGYQLFRMWSERRAIELTDDEVGIQERLFPSLGRADFFALWSIGSTYRHRAGETLIEQGAWQETIMLLLEGKVEVLKDGEVVATAGPDKLLGEMSYLLNEPASATVRTTTEVAVRTWDQQKMSAMAHLNRRAHEALMTFISRDLARKL